MGAWRPAQAGQAPTQTVSHHCDRCTECPQGIQGNQGCYREASMGHFIAALLGKLFADEFEAWLPWITERVTRAAIRRLAEDQRERYDEEWRSHLDEVPGELSKVWVA